MRPWLARFAWHIVGRRALVLGALVTVGLAPSPAAAQFEGFALYEVGLATTDLGSEDGLTTMTYGVGAGGSYGLMDGGGLHLVVGGDIMVRGFGLEVPGRVEAGVGVFDQNDVRIDEFAALRRRPFTVGVYFEQRRIDRGRAGTIGFPAAGIGVLAEVGAGARTSVRFTYAGFPSGSLRVEGVAGEPALTSGRSVRFGLTHRLTPRWSLSGEFQDTRMDFEPVPPTLSFFDHRQTSVTAGAVLTF